VVKDDGTHECKYTGGVGDGKDMNEKEQVSLQTENGGEGDEDGSSTMITSQPLRPPPRYPWHVGTKQVHEDSKARVSERFLVPGQRVSMRQHAYDYHSYVVEGSRLAIYDDEGKRVVTIKTEPGNVFDFKLEEEELKSRSGALKKNLPSRYSIENIGNSSYKEVIVEHKPKDPEANRAEGADGEELDEDDFPYLPGFLDFELREMRKLVLAQFKPEQLEREVMSTYNVALPPQCMSIRGFQQGKLANGKEQASLAGIYTWAWVMTFNGRLGRDDTRKDMDYKLRVKTMMEQHLQSRLVLDYYPNIVVDVGDTGMAPVIRHYIIATFKADAPIFRIFSRFNDIAQNVEEVWGYEHGVIANHHREMTLAEGFEYVFLLTFEDKENRNSFLHTTANINLMEEIEEYASKYLVFDFVEEVLLETRMKRIDAEAHKRVQESLRDIGGGVEEAEKEYFESQTNAL